MEGGMSYVSVQAAVAESANIVSDPPRTLDMDLARQHVAALDQLPRPTLVTCRTGPRSSALVYLYTGLRAGATSEEVLARAEADAAPFTGSEELKARVAQGLAELSRESTALRLTVGRRPEPGASGRAPSASSIVARRADLDRCSRGGQRALGRLEPALPASYPRLAAACTHAISAA